MKGESLFSFSPLRKWHEYMCKKTTFAFSDKINGRKKLKGVLNIYFLHFINISIFRFSRIAIYSHGDLHDISNIALGITDITASFIPGALVIEHPELTDAKIARGLLVLNSHLLASPFYK